MDGASSGRPCVSFTGPRVASASGVASGVGASVGCGASVAGASVGCGASVARMPADTSSDLSMPSATPLSTTLAAALPRLVALFQVSIAASETAPAPFLTTVALFAIKSLTLSCTRVTSGLPVCTVSAKPTMVTTINSETTVTASFTSVFQRSFFRQSMIMPTGQRISENRSVKNL